MERHLNPHISRLTDNRRIDVNSSEGSNHERLTVSIVIPVAKEGEGLYDRISELNNQLRSMLASQHNLSYEILLVTDVFHIPTLRALIKLAKSGVVRSFFLTRNIGKGGSIKNVIPISSGDYIVILDADIPIPPKVVLDAVKLAYTKKLDLVIANRIYRPHSTFRKFLSISYNTLTNILFRTGLRDHQAGFKILSRRAADIILVNKTRTDGLAYDTEIIVWAKKYGLKIKTINVTWIEHREGSTILPIRALLTMLADLIALRILTINEKRVSLRKIAIGKIIELGKYDIVGDEFMTVINASGIGKTLLDTLRKLYIAVAFRR